MFAFAILTASIAVAQPPLPALRVEAVPGGSVLFVKNGHTKPLAAFFIEMVGYPGTRFTYFQDNAEPPVPPGTELRIPITNMTVGAAPEYVKMQAAIYTDGSKAGTAQKVAQLEEHRRAKERDQKK